MKKSIVLAIVGLAAGMIPSSHGQGAIKLDSYDSYGPYVLYGAGGDGSIGTGVSSAYTVGLYFWNGPGNNVALIPFDFTGFAIPSSLNPNLILGTGSGSTAVCGYGATPGAYWSAANFYIPGSDPNGGQTWTLMLIAYEGSSYASAPYRGHSAAFTVTTAAGASPSPTWVSAPIFIIPEPTTLALSGPCSLSLLLMRRKKA